MLDGTYFHKEGCLAIVMDAVRKLLLDYWYIERESFDTIHPRLIALKHHGLTPQVATLDGHRRVTEAMRTTWPEVLIQRCLFHIENQGLRWLRTYPKTEAGQTLRTILKTVTAIRSQTDQEHFLMTYANWLQKYSLFIRQLPRTSIVNKDLKRTVSSLSKALPDMFYFIKDPKIAKTTNLLEGFYSQLKHQYQRHRGLSRSHKIAFLYWYCYFKNLKNSNTL